MEQNIKLKFVEEKDIKQWWEKKYGSQSDLNWMQYNGPYFKDPVQTWEEFHDSNKAKAINNPMRKLILYNDEIVGEVSAYWEDGKLKQWLEVGIVLFDSNSWGHGIGTIALRQWIIEMFELFSYLPHIGFTTWSGNIGMEIIGDKLGMTKEGVIRKVRYWENKYYDSIKYGILRNEI
ncbi:GNAT family N-acetyltransferase [Leuconostoc carnosum]|uniref:GNAT family N-acetyltransferase n=1 Tax=Leuconostoc carnosum TaxID=1252 RepID=UPI0016132230|nr:GNAT family protein [Leuconostoc carnosum]MBB6432950.1 RimJ/RimL family protein N-acetyltransferase [Leuconostoc carnosum]